MVANGSSVLFCCDSVHQVYLPALLSAPCKFIKISRIICHVLLPPIQLSLLYLLGGCSGLGTAIWKASWVARGPAHLWLWSSKSVLEILAGRCSCPFRSSACKPDWEFSVPHPISHNHKVAYPILRASDLLSPLSLDSVSVLILLLFLLRVKLAFHHLIISLSSRYSSRPFSFHTVPNYFCGISA